MGTCLPDDHRLFGSNVEVRRPLPRRPYAIGARGIKRQSRRYDAASSRHGRQLFADAMDMNETLPALSIGARDVERVLNPTAGSKACPRLSVVASGGTPWITRASVKLGLRSAVSRSAA
jgi:hypothetical protein